MQKLIKENIDFVLSSNSQSSNTIIIKKILTSLNERNLIILSGMKNTGKINILKEFLTRTSTTQNFFYFNKSLDIDNKIKTHSDLEKLLQGYIDTNGEPKIIILHNTNKIEGIKNTIGKLYKEKNKNGKGRYKIILLGNNIRIDGIEDIEVVSKSSSQILEEESGNIESISRYGNLEKVRGFVTWEKSTLKENYIELIKNDILLNDIFNSFSVKNINLYNYTISFLSKNNSFLSLRDLQKKLDEHKSISLKTTIDYIDFSIQSKIIRKMYKYDIKSNKHISSKAKYYFTDLGIRNSCNNFSTHIHSLKENLVFNDLYNLGFEVYGGMNGKFDFSFIAKSDDEKIYIHLSKQTEKEEIKKEVRKLLKIGGDEKSYLVIDGLDDLGLKKFQYESVEIVKIEELLVKIKT